MRKKSYLLISYFIFIISVGLVSCSKYLDIKPYDRTIPDDAEDFAALLNYLCDEIDKGSTYGEVTVGSVSLSADMETITDNIEMSLSSNTWMSMYIGQTLNSKQSVYKNLYEVIRNCNIILGEFEDGRNSLEGRNIVAAAYALRGVCYYQLLRQFCVPPLADDARLGVPLVTHFDMEAKPTRSSITETTRQVESDLLTALELDNQNAFYLFTPTAVRAYLARLYHWCGRWEEARTQALAVVEECPLLDAEAYATMMQTQYGLTGNRFIMGNRIYTSTTGIALSGITSHLSENVLSASYVHLYDAEGTRDVRRRNSLFFNRKRKNRKLLFAGIRSAEMALVAMECAYHIGDHTTALAELNALRRLRITDYEDLTETTLPPVDADALVKVDALGQPLTPLLQAILNERRKEMYLENGDRWFELKRNGRPEWWVARDGNKYWTRRYMYTFPLPVEDIEVTPGLEQNPGYEETY